MTMPRSQSGPNFPTILSHLSIIQRKYTVSPPRHHECTALVAHGFNPLASATPLPTAMVQNTDPRKMEYLSLPLPITKKDEEDDEKKTTKMQEEVCLSSPVSTHESHGFIRSCCVAVVERDEEVMDYVPHEISIKNLAEVRNLSPSGTVGSDTPLPRFHGYTSTADVPIEELRHQTGSPLQERDIVLSSDNFRTPGSPHSVPKLRGGGVRDPMEDVAEEERRQCSSTISPVTPDSEDTIYILDDSTRAFYAALARLERYGPRGDLPNAPGPSTSEYSGSEYSESASCTGLLDVEKDVIHESSLSGKEHIALAEALALTDDAWRHMAETTALPDGSDAEDSDAADDESAELSQVHEPDISNQNPLASEEQGDERASRMQSIREQEESSSSIPYSPSATMSGLEASQSPSQHGTLRQQTNVSSHSARSSTLFKITVTTTPKHLSACLAGPTLDITNGTTGEMYVANVPKRMLLHFCGPAVLERLTPAYTFTTIAHGVLEIPSSEADGVAIARVIRYMRRCCSAPSHKASGEMRIPHTMRDGLETIRACRVLELFADARRIERLIAREWMCDQTFDTTSETLKAIWSSYFGTFRESEMGDAIVWFALHETHKDTHGLAAEMRVLLDQEEFWSLRMRVREEIGGRCWRAETKEQFLDRCGRERENLVRTRVRTEREAREREEGIEKIRAIVRLEAPVPAYEGNAEISKMWEAPESLPNVSGNADEKSKFRPESTYSLVDDKPLPRLPSVNHVQLDSLSQIAAESRNEQQVQSTSVHYAAAARAVNRIDSQTYTRNSGAADFCLLPLVPAPKKRSRIGRIFTAVFSG